ncbi:MAG: serine/threonine protein kinase [Gallionella sp.]|nr:serine/threonine protein kinase [Gallionella sp.]
MTILISNLGRYEVLGELGQGAMGVVYKARDPLIDRVVAIKTINLSLAMDEKDEYEGRFYQEARAAGRLNHPNIVTIYDVGKSGDVAYIAMELLEGRELRDIMNEGPLLPIDQVLNIVAQVAQGLAYAHEHEIVHRDVKPSNIMVIRDGHVKITDFGIARMESSSVRTQTGMVLGSPKYMSPEQVMGKTIDPRSDIFSLGVMLYEMLTGQAPFDGENVNAIMYQTLNAVTPPPNTINPDVPEMVNFIVAKALAKGVEDRYQNAKDFAADLRTCRDTMPHSIHKVDLSIPPVASKSKLPDTVEITRKGGGDTEGIKSESNIRLSKAFDSSVATMRLAALTASSEDVDELSKTLNIPRPSAKSINQAGAVRVATKPLPKNRPSGSQPPEDTLNQLNGWNLLMTVIALLVLFGVTWYFFF